MRHQWLKTLFPVSLLVLTLALAPVATSAPNEPDSASSSASQAPATAVPPAAAQVPAADPVSAEIAGTYSGNAKSKVFHKQGCRFFACKTCTLTFTSPAEATAKGFKPCKICMK